jgi:hypothetical protein
VTKVELFSLGFPIECKHHGLHLNWRIHTNSNIKCNLCASWHQKRAREKDPIKFLLKDAKQHSKQKNREFSITLDDLLEKLVVQDNKCALSSIEFSKENKPSLDRIDSSKGYTKDNIQLVLKEVNIMKSNFNQDYFIHLCSLIAKKK